VNPEYILLVSLLVCEQTFRTWDGRWMVFFGFIVILRLKEFVDSVLGSMLCKKVNIDVNKIMLYSPSYQKQCIHLQFDQRQRWHVQRSCQKTLQPSQLPLHQSG